MMESVRDVFDSNSNLSLTHIIQPRIDTYSKKCTVPANERLWPLWPNDHWRCELMCGGGGVRCVVTTVVYSTLHCPGVILP